jgi:hypothetical protein
MTVDHRQTKGLFDVLVLQGRLTGHPRSGAKIDAEPFAPYRNRAIVRQVRLGTESVVLAANIPLHGAYIDEARMQHARAVFCVARSHQRDMDVGAVRGLEIREAQNAGAIGLASDGRPAFGGMQNTIKRSGLKGLSGRSRLRGGCHADNGDLPNRNRQSPR